MDVAGELVSALRQALGECGYADVVLSGEVALEAVLSTPSARRPRLLCAVAQMPTAAATARDALAFVQGIRRCLARQHTGLPWPKRMGTYLVLLAEHELFEALRDQDETLVDTGAMHLNILLGTILIDGQTFRTRSDNVLGLIDAGDHFGRIQGVVDEWSRARRCAQGTYRTNGRALSVA